MAVAQPPPARSRQGIEYVDAGSGPPVLVVHGTPGGHDQGLVLGRCLLDAGFRVIAVSRPGYLGTELATGPSPTEQADRYAELLTELELDRVGVFCWSGGGPSAYRLAVRHPDRVTAVVAASAVAGPFTLRSPSVDERLLMGTGLGRRILELMARGTPDQLVAATIAAEGRLSKAELKERTAQVLSSDAERTFVLELARTANYSGDRRAGHDNDADQFRAIESLELERISAATLLVHGLVDSDVGPEQSRLAAAAIPGAELAELELGTHLAFWINPAAPAIRERAFALLREHTAT